MQKPKCRLCGERHWLSEPHANVTANVTGRGGGTGKGRQRVHGTNAGRQAAYRQRVTAARNLGKPPQ